MMDAHVYGKKQYWILIGIAVVTSFLLPLLCNIYVMNSFYHAAELNAARSLDWIANAVLTFGQLSSMASSAVFIFTVIRFRFRLCLPLIAIPLLGTLAEICLSFVQPDIIYSKNYLLVLLFALISCVGQLADIGIIKAITRHIKKEAIQLFFIFLSLFVVGVLFTVMRTELNYWMMVKQHVGSYEIQAMIISALLRGLFIFIFYLVLRLLFAHNRRQTARMFFACIKGEIQKSIE